jgi:hypothetical protein
VERHHVRSGLQELLAGGVPGLGEIGNQQDQVGEAISTRALLDAGLLDPV